MMIQKEENSSIRLAGKGNVLLQILDRLQCCCTLRTLLKHKRLLTVAGAPLTVSCAYSGRVAVAYKKSAEDSPTDNKPVTNLYVSIFECESTGKILIKVVE
jgi:hypothetical protein